MVETIGNKALTEVALTEICEILVQKSSENDGS